MASASFDPMDRLPTGLKLFVRNLQSLTPVKLDDTNYPSWSATVRANLLAHRLLGYVDGSEPSPPSLILDEKAASPGKDEPPVMKPNLAYESWRIVDAQIRACLLAIVSPAVQTHIHALPTSLAIWNHLEQRYNSLSRTHIFQLKERLHGVTKGTDSMQSYLDMVLTIVSSLKLAHEEISEQDIILCVLRGLPADYASLKQNIRTNIATVTFNQVSSWLLSEELNLSFEKKLSLGDSGSTSSVEIHTALYTNSRRGNGRGRGRGPQRGRGGPYRGSQPGGRGGRQPHLSQPNYKKWSRLFLLLVRRFNLQGYINGSIVPLSKDDDEWLQLDALLQGWILSTISDEVSDLVISSVSTASALWKFIHDLFHDNKNTPAMQLEHEFRTTVKGNTTMAAYCQHLQNLADWPEDVDAPVSQHQLVLQMLHGLPADLQAQTDRSHPKAQLISSRFSSLCMMNIYQIQFFLSCCSPRLAAPPVPALKGFDDLSIEKIRFGYHISTEITRTNMLAALSLSSGSSPGCHDLFGVEDLLLHVDRDLLHAREAPGRNRNALHQRIFFVFPLDHSKISNPNSVQIRFGYHISTEITRTNVLAALSLSSGSSPGCHDLFGVDDLLLHVDRDLLHAREAPGRNGNALHQRILFVFPLDHSNTAMALSDYGFEVSGREQWRTQEFRCLNDSALNGSDCLFQPLNGSDV
ncbi:unnamed protein product [Cuscuta campestris]|uniref:Uncharacterized protein n=1 Tax=Cuscuta campestris TaxID=132261 RepID=A0A484M3B4_9ASTE|nr:unnamed protein product [Cuscuta campestris]